jgi:site-specific recombinase
MAKPIAKNLSEDKVLSLLQKWFSFPVAKTEEVDVDLLTHIIYTLRPNQTEKLKFYSIQPIIEVMKNHPVLRQNLTNYLKTILETDYKFSSIISDAGIIKGASFFSELRTRIFAKFMPIYPAKDQLEYVLNQSFYHAKDIVWLSLIPKSEIKEILLLLMGGGVDQDAYLHMVREVNRGIEILLLRICGRIMEPEMLKMTPQYDARNNPFSEYQLALDDIFDKMEAPNYRLSDQEKQHLFSLHNHCEDFVNNALFSINRIGISVTVNQYLIRIKQQLDRVEMFVNNFVIQEYETNTDRAISLYLNLIELNCYKNTVRNLFDESTNLIAYEITQHTAKTGEMYITDDWKDFGRMLYSALGGGFIVAILVINKLLISKLGLSAFGFAVAYSLNYSLGFIAIFLCGFTLATKQPAMTAAALMKTIKDKYDGNNEDKYDDFGALFARLVRSQLVAFFGNVIMALPVAMFGIWLIDYFTGVNIANDKWPKLINDLSPISSLAIVHASIAGFYLFLSGLISGYISNRNKHFDISLRIRENPSLKRNFSKEQLKRISDQFELKWPGIVSNFWFGVFLGSTWSVGQFLGLNLDIRHITFAAGNFSLGTYGSEFSLTMSMVVWSLVGILIIGFLNFIVSFLLSLTLAFRARRIPVTEIRPILASIAKRWRTSRRSFFYPRKEI